MKEKESHVQKNQEFWRGAKRGNISRPLELQRTATFLHERMVRTFDLEDPEMPILTWSILYDRPKTPSAMFVYAERIPEEITDEDQGNFIAGMGRITEYATNYATRAFIRKNMNLPFLRDLGNIYSRAADLTTYEILLNGTYRRMAQVESLANKNGKNYEEAIERALFQHNFEPVNELVEDTKPYSGWSSLSDIAIEIGQKRFSKPDLGKWLNKIEVEKEDGPVKTHAKNTLISVVAGGVYRSPGITEVSAGITGVVFAETAIIYAASIGKDILNDPSTLQKFMPVISENLAVAAFPIVAITPAIAIHELIHGYSSNKDYMGLIPAILVNKETIPYFTRMETEEKTLR